MSDQTLEKIKLNMARVAGKDNPIKPNTMVISVTFDGECSSGQWEAIREKLAEGLEVYAIPDFQTQITIAMRSEIDDVKRSNNTLKIEVEKLKRNLTHANTELDKKIALLSMLEKDLGF